MEKNWIPIDAYTSIRLSHYKGKYSVMLGTRGESDTYDTWVCATEWKNAQRRPKTKKDGSWLLVPVQIPLGESKEEAVKTLKNLLFALGG